MENSCIVSVAFRQPYVRHLETLTKVCEGYGIEIESTVDCYHYNGRIIMSGLVEHFQSTLYGFKPHAINRVMNYGVKKIVWFDPAILPTVSPQILFDALEEHPILVGTGDHKLASMTNDKAKKWFNVTDEDIKDVHHVAGTIYGFNFNDPKAVEVFELWLKAEQAGIFGTQDEFMANHWADESCLALAMFKSGVPQYMPEFTYLNQKNL